MYFNDAIERINNIKWDIVGKNVSKEDTDLGYEFLRRLAKFFKEESIKPIVPLFANIASLFGDDEGEIVISDYCNPVVSEFLGDDKYQKSIVQYYLQLAKYADKNSHAAKYLSVYDPMIKIHERGGDYVLRIYELEIVNAAHYPLSKWYEHFIEKEPIDISEL